MVQWRRLLILVLLSLPLSAQVKNQFPALGANNIFTGSDQFTLGVNLGPLTFGTLQGGPGSIVYCKDCQAVNPCIGGGTGAFAQNIQGVWDCASPGSGSGSGGLSSFTVGSLDPLFTASLGANPTTSPALTFSLESQTANTVFGNCTGTGGLPAFCNITSAMLPATITSNTSGTAATITGAITESQVTNLVSDLASKAPTASPTFTGTVNLPTLGVQGPETTTPVAPPSGFQKAYFKAGFGWCSLDSNGSEKCAGASGAFSGGTGTSYQDVANITQPGNPGTGFCRLFINAATGNLSGITSTGASCVSSGSGGSGTVTTLTATNNLTSLLTIAIANPNTTPNISFTSPTFCAHCVWMNNTGGLATPTAVQPAFTDVSGVATVGQGGTGGSSFTAHGVLLGEGSSALGVTASGTTGTVLHGNTGADPTYSPVSLAADVSGVLAPANGGTGTSNFQVSGPTALRTYTFPDASATVLTNANAVTVGQGGTGLTSGNSGGLLYFSNTTTLASTIALTAHGVLLGEGAGTSPTATTAGTAGQCLISNGAAADPTFQPCASGTGTVNTGSQFQLPIYATSGNTLSPDSLLSDNGTALSYAGTGGISSGKLSATSSGPGAVVLTAGSGSNTVTLTAPAAAITTSYTETLPATVAAGTWQNDASGNISFGTLTVGNGGTGGGSFTVHGVVVGEGTSPFATTAAGAVGTVLHGQGTLLDPSFSAVSLTADVSGILPVANGGTGTGTATGTAGSVVLSQSPTITTPTLAGATLSGELQLTSQVATVAVTADATTGVTANLLAKINSAGNAITAATTDTTVPAYVAQNTSTASARLVVSGLATCTVDGVGSTAGDYAIASTAIAGRCADGGASIPSGVCVVGVWKTTTGGNSNGTLAVTPAFCTSAAGTGSGTVNAGLAGQFAYYATSTNAVSGNPNFTISGSTATLGVAGSALGSLLLAGSTSGGPTLTSQASGGSLVIALPNSAPALNQVVTATGVSGNNVTLGWSNGGGGTGGGQTDYPVSYQTREDNLGLSSTGATTVANTSSATSLLGSFVGRQAIPAGAMIPYTSGAKTLRVYATGTFASVTTPNLTIAVLLGGVTLFTQTFTAVPAGPVPWVLDFHFTITGLTTASGGGCVSYISSGTPVAACASSASITGLNFATSQNLDVQATWNAVSSSDTITANEVTAYPVQSL